MEDLIKFFVDPKFGGYTLQKTLLYSILFLIVAYVVFKILKKFKFRFDVEFFTSILPLVFLTSTIRVLEDYSIISGNIFVTPQLQLTFLPLFLSTIILMKIFLKEKWGKAIFIFGLFLLSFSLTFLPLKNFHAFLYHFLATFSLLTITAKLPTSPENKILIFSIMFECLITLINVQVFGFFEQHFITRSILEFSPILYPVVRILFLILLIKTADIYFKEKSTNNYIKFLFSILSLGIGFRNLLQSIAS